MDNKQIQSYRRLKDSGVGLQKAYFPPGIVTNVPAKRIDLPVGEIVKKYKSGESIKAIAEEYDVSRSPIEKRLREENVKIRKDAASKSEQHSEYYEEWREMYVEDGMSIIEIADEYNTTDATVSRRLRKMGVEMRTVSETKRNSEIRDKEMLQEMYVKQDMTIEEMASELPAGMSAVWAALQELGFNTSHDYPTGKDHPNWKGGYHYESHKWKKARKQRIDLDGGECVICKMGRNEHKEQFGRDIHVHHIKPLVTFENGEEAHNIDNLITLCASCHARWEGVPLKPDHE